MKAGGHLLSLMLDGFQLSSRPPDSGSLAGSHTDSWTRERRGRARGGRAGQRGETSLYNRRFGGKRGNVRTISCEVRARHSTGAPYSSQRRQVSAKLLSLLCIRRAMNNDPRHLPSPPPPPPVAPTFATSLQLYDVALIPWCRGRAQRHGAGWGPPTVLYTRTKDIVSLLRAAILSIGYRMKGFADGAPLPSHPAFYILSPRIITFI